MIDLTGVAGIISAIVGTGVGTALLQMWREGRQHRWDEEKAARLAGEAEKTRTRIAAEEREERRIAADALEEKMNAQAMHLALSIAEEATAARRGRAQIHEAIGTVQEAVGTAIVEAKEAYREANNVNAKISDLNRELLDQRSAEQRERTARLPRIQETTEATKAIVEEINGKIPAR